MKEYKIAAFYEFRRMPDGDALSGLKDEIRSLMISRGIKGTVILAAEGYNSTVCGRPEDLDRFLESLSDILGSAIEPKFSFHDSSPFRRTEVKIKPEIVTFRNEVSWSKGTGTFVGSEKWNALISDPQVLVLDTRNDYEYQCGTFEGAINPGTDKFSDLVRYVENTLLEKKDTPIALFCTGGIRCEKFAPFLKEKGFTDVYQLKGGILRYLEETKPEDQLWKGECYVFDQRVSVDSKLEKGRSPDPSQNLLTEAFEPDDRG